MCWGVLACFLFSSSPENQKSGKKESLPHFHLEHNIIIPSKHQTLPRPFTTSNCTMKFAVVIAALAFASNVASTSAFAPASNSLQTRSASPFLAKASVRSARNSLSMVTEGNGGGVVVTGGAGGVGFAYAGEFMDRGYDVVICDVKDCTTAAKVLASRHPNGRIFHTKCDVSDAKSVQALGKFAQSKMGKVGYWINNAGINGGRRALMDVSVGMVESVVKVNLLGVLLGTKVAMDIMASQVSKAV